MQHNPLCLYKEYYLNLSKSKSEIEKVYTMKKIIPLISLIVVVVISGCNKEQKISECVEACVCVGNYEQPDRDSADIKFACRMVCDNSQYNTDPVYNGLLDDLDTKLNKFRMGCEDYTEKTEQTDLWGDKLDKAKELCDMQCSSHNGVVEINPHATNENIVDCGCGDGYTGKNVVVPT